MSNELVDILIRGGTLLAVLLPTIYSINRWVVRRLETFVDERHARLDEGIQQRREYVEGRFTEIITRLDQINGTVSSTKVMAIDSAGELRRHGERLAAVEGYEAGRKEREAK